MRKSSKSLSLQRYVKRARLRRGAVAEIRISKPNNEGVMRRITVRKTKAKVPVKIDDLLPVGSSRARSC